jgi:hypothetical protein
MRFAAANFSLARDWWFFTSDEDMCMWLLNHELTYSVDLWIPDYIGN